MALGGGTFLSINKVLPGSYINFISAKKASGILSDRGIAAMALFLDWGVSDEIFEVSAEDFEKKSLQIFGYNYTHPKMRGLRDLFKNVKTLYAFRLNSGGEYAENAYAVAKYKGNRGNALKVVIKKNAAYTDTNMYDVELLFDGIKIYSETASSIAELSENNYVSWKREAVAVLTAGEPLTGGKNDENIGGDYLSAQHAKFLEKAESYSFNAIGCPYDDIGINGIYADFAKRLRDDVGVKFQAVCFNIPADHEGVVNVVSEISSPDESFGRSALIYWITGIIAGCAVNRSNLNRKYDGDFVINIDYSQSKLVEAIKNGQFMLHNVNGERKVLADINSLVTVTAEKGDNFKENQTVRVIDQIANDVALMFNERYLGIVPNNDSGRASLWSDIVTHHQTLSKLGAISDFLPEDIKVEQGETKRSVIVSDVIMPMNAMAQLYMTCIVE
ncbi:MAG: phage tail sheath family protein [Eubacterium sp.]|jgi:hypothetical protein|nr:phage tail sheath family protein [Eubacterium sp.]